MTARIIRTSQYNGEFELKTFDTLEALLKWVKEAKEEVILMFDDETNTWTLEIYDDWRE